MAILKTRIETGAVRGVPGGNPLYTVFKGIPYAAPTSGENRFAPPKPAESWEGERLCDTFSHICIQAEMMPGMSYTDFFIKEFYPFNYPQSEESLCLNVWTPAKDSGEKLPVMVWIHGGGLGSGYGHEMEFDGEAICKRGAILVTINYRVDVLAFFAHPELSAEYGQSGNLWLKDQIAALEWVRRNISAFGGDADNVTIFGQSAGAGSVLSHLTSPLSEGLFSKAIVQSGSFGVGGGRPTATLEQGEAWGVQACKILGKTVSDLRSMTGQEAFEALKYAAENGAGPAPSTLIDTEILPYSQAKAFAIGYAKNVPIMVGCVNGDGGLFQKPDATEEERLMDALRPRLLKKTDDFLEKYPLNGEGGEMARAADASGAKFGDIATAYGQIKNGHIAPYVYYFNPFIPGHNCASFVKDGIAYHSSEMWYTFGVLHRCWRRFDGRHYDLSQSMTDYWTNFAKTGDPNGNGLPPWPAFTEDCRKIIYLNERYIHTENEDDETLYKFLDIFHDAQKSQ